MLRVCETAIQWQPVDMTDPEQRTGKPAFSSNVATLWAALRRLPRPCGPITGSGRVLANSRVSATDRAVDSHRRIRRTSRPTAEAE